MIVGTIDMMGRGIDIPEIDTVFLFAPVKFEWTVVQAIWRALRSTPNKPEVKVYDWLDLPLLTKQATARRAAYKQEYWADVLIDKLYIKWIEPQN
jgi:superfamily II DNA or RNA helicase